MRKIVCFGEALIDFFAQPVATPETPWSTTTLSKVKPAASACACWWLLFCSAVETRA